MGTKIQQYGLGEADFRGDRFNDIPGQLKGNNDVLSLTRPDVIADIHRAYLAVGADIITTNTFSSQRISQADYHLEEAAYDMALAGARIARQAADEFSTDDKPRFVAGSIGPTNKTCSMSPDVSDPAARDLDYDTLLAAYEEQMDGLIEGGVDTLLIETIFDSLNAKVAIDAAITAMQHRHCELPIMLSVTVSDLAGRTLSGQTLDAFMASVSTYPIFSIGLNCSFGARQMKPFLRELAQRAPYYISCYPNAGLPNSLSFYEKAGIRLLKDEVLLTGDLAIVGRFDRMNFKRKAVKALTANIDPKKYIILLDHQPYNLQDAEQSGVDFQLSGHTHHGQIWPVSWITESIYECAFGQHQRGNTNYYVSSGIGLWGGKFRIGTCSEYVVADITPATAE
jgi:methionine synthase I (cobalamin-dependent)